MRLITPVMFTALLSLSACTWVEPTPESTEVLLVRSFNVESCKRVGTASVSVKHKVGVYTRSQEKVTEELVTLAKNKAAEMGGDSIVAKGEPEEGSMSYDVYKCGE